LDLSNDEIDTTAFGSTWKKSDVGMRGWSLSIEGHYDPSDTTGQGLVEAAWAAGSLMSTVRVYVDSASYWIPDVTTDSLAGGRVTSYAINSAHDAVAGISMTLAGSGPITFV
jgi:predicted secreted protein